MADHPNLELLRRGYAAYGSGDMDTINELFADDVVWHVAGRNPLSGDYNGKEQVFGFFEDNVHRVRDVLFAAIPRLT